MGGRADVKARFELADSLIGDDGELSPAKCVGKDSAAQ
jgi:hypothetical protein